MQPKSKLRHSKVAVDMFRTHFMWSLWYLAIMFIIHMLIGYLSQVREMDLNFMDSVTGSAKIFMLIVVWFVSYGYLGTYVTNGITRKEFFTGSAIAAGGISLIVMVIAAAVTEIQRLIRLTPWVSHGANIAYMERTELLIVPVLSMTLILFCYYTAGWIISMGFYRHGKVRGIPFVGLGAVYLAITDILWNGLYEPVTSVLGISPFTPSLLVSFGGTLFLIALGLALVRVLTLGVAVKLE